jgi:hypothetical protein
MERWISVRTRLGASFERASEVLATDVGSLLPADGIASLAVEVAGRATVRQDVVVTFGDPRAAEGEAWVPIEWRPVAHQHLLPTFHGVLEVAMADEDGEAELALTGTYEVPLGVVGHFGDGIVGRRIAQQSLRLLLEDLVGELDRRAVEGAPTEGSTPVARAVDISERAAPRF